MRFSPDSRHLAYLDQKGVVRIWDVLQDKIVDTRTFTDFHASCLAMGAHDRFAVAGPDGVRVYGVGSGQIAEFKTPATAMFMLFDAAGSNLAVADDAGKVTVYDIQTKKSLIFLLPRG